MQALRSWGLHCLDQKDAGTELERRKLWFHACWVFLRLEKVSGGPTKGEAASQPNFLALDFFPIAISLQVPQGTGRGGSSPGPDTGCAGSAWLAECSVAVAVLCVAHG